MTALPTHIPSLNTRLHVHMSLLVSLLASTCTVRPLHAAQVPNLPVTAANRHRCVIMAVRVSMHRSRHPAHIRRYTHDQSFLLSVPLN
jgi:hypothetical protein